MSRTGPQIAIVTDSTASLPDEVAQQRGIRVVPLQVVIGGTSYDEGSDAASPETVADALKEWTPVSTSRATPAAMLECYRELADGGATEIVSVHLSGEMSGTAESAEMAGRESPVPVHVVDTRQVGFAVGFAAVTAADVVAGGGGGQEAAAAARERAAGATSLFYVDTLEYLRRGGRIGAASAILGSALAVKPLLRIDDGRIGPIEKVRTAGRALARLADLATEAADAATTGLEVGVAHLDSPDRADALAETLAERLGDRLVQPIRCAELGAVLGAHVGPGMVAVAVVPRL